MSQDDINKEKVSYLLKLLGKSHLSLDPDSDFEDIPDSLTMMLTAPAIEADALITPTTQAQNEVESTIREIYEDLVDEASRECRNIKNDSLNTKKLLKYLDKSLNEPMNELYYPYDPNHGWMLYWLVNPYYVLKESNTLDESTKKLASDKIQKNLINNGYEGIGGGKNQLGHIASTYASILTLVVIGDYSTLKSLQKPIYDWLMSLKLSNGSFLMHKQGEHDARSTYCALVIASLLNVLTKELCENTLSWLNKCQTYEGGFSGIPGTEAHGGYTFCSVASYFLLLGSSDDFGKELAENIDLDLLISWVSHRQLQLEGGFNGRSNKLVDACYSFWIGAVGQLLEPVLNIDSLFDKDALKCYILNCSQNSVKGGFRDKPGKSVDFYHTNYTLLGLSITEHSLSFPETSGHDYDSFAFNFQSKDLESTSSTNPINPVFGLPLGVAEACKLHLRN